MYRSAYIILNPIFFPWLRILTYYLFIGLPTYSHAHINVLCVYDKHTYIYRYIDSVDVDIGPSRDGFSDSRCRGRRNRRFVTEAAILCNRSSRFYLRARAHVRVCMCLNVLLNLYLELCPSLCLSTH